MRLVWDQEVVGSNPTIPTTFLEDDAVGLVPRLALKTRFSEMGWGSTPLSSAKIIESGLDGKAPDC